MSECMPRPHVHLSRPLSGPPSACLSFCKLVYLLSIVNAATLYLSVERDTVEPHIGANWLCEWAVVFMRLGNDTFTVSKAMAHSMGHSAIFSKVPDYGAVLAPTSPLPGDFDLLFHGDGL